MLIWMLAALPRLGRLDQRQPEFSAAHGHDVHFRVGGLRGEIAVVLVELLNALLVFFQLGGIVGLREQVLEEDRVRNPVRVQILHRALISRGSLHVLVARRR